MNQRSRNRSRHAAMPCGQPVECIDCNGVAQHHRDLASLISQRRLSLRACLGFGHSGRRQITHVLQALAVGLQFRQLRGDGLAPLFFGGSDRKPPLLNSDSNKVSCLFTDQGGEVSALSKNFIHDRPHSGPIPPMSESYAVTSDVSTPFDIAPQQVAA